MLTVYELTGTVNLVIVLALIAMKALAFADSLRYRAEAYEAAGKLTKVAWCLILGLGFAAQMILRSPLGLLGLAFTIAAIVYFVDVRPAVREVLGRGQRR